MDPERTRRPFAVGDPLRAIAALTVMASHVTGVAVLTWFFDTGDSAQMERAFGALGDVLGIGGPFGVSLFFVLSGYLLARPFVRSFALGAPRPSLARFTRNRILRVVPAYWALLALIVVAVVLPGVDDAPAGRIARLYLFDGGHDRPLGLWAGHGWTLDVEMRFYLALGLGGAALALIGPRLPVGRPARLGLLAAVAAGIAIWSFTQHPLRDPLFAVDFGSNVGRFTTGILLAVIEAAQLQRVRSAVAARLAVGLFVAGAVALVAGCLAQDDTDMPLGRGAPWLVTISAGMVVAGPLLWQWSGRAAWPVLDRRFLHWAGSRSYSIYLVHLPVFSGLLTATGEAPGYVTRAVILLLAGVPLALGAAELLHRYVEVPFLRRRA